MPSVSMPLEQFFELYIFIISIIVIFVLGYTHTQKDAYYSFIIHLSFIIIINLSMFLYRSDVSIAPAH